jgi:hypothetical protein
MKKVFLLILLPLLLMGVASASMEWDNTHEYKDNDMTVEIIDRGIFAWLGLDEKIGDATLKSHINLEQPKRVMKGRDRPVMWYEFNEFEFYEEGLGEVTFIDMKTGEEIQKDYYFAKATEEGWERLQNNDIPEGTTTIALITDVYSGDYIDGIWEIAGQKIEKHAVWNESFSDDLFLYYSFDDESDTDDNIVDTTGNGFTLTSRTGDPTIVSNGIIGDGYDLNSEGDLISDTFDVDWNGTSIAISLWFNGTSFNADENFFRLDADNSPQNKQILYYNDGKQLQFISGGGAWYNLTSPTENVWHHVCVSATNGSDNIIFVVDGENRTYTTAGTVAVLDSMGTTTINIGAPGADGTNSILDEIAVWNTSRTVAECQLLYDSGVGMSYDPWHPKITLNSPVDGYNSSVSSVSLNYTCVDAEMVDNSTISLSNGTSITTTNGTINETTVVITQNYGRGDYDWEVSCVNNDSISDTSSTRSFSVGSTILSSDFNTSTFETATETYRVNISSFGSATPTNIQLDWNGTNYSATATALGGGNFTLSASRTIPTITSKHNATIEFNWEIGGVAEVSNTYQQELKLINFYYCPTNTSNFINISFKDEGNSSDIKASIPTSTFEYYIGDGSVLKNLTYVNTTEHFSYPFCFNTTDRNVTTDIRLQYEGSDYPQRVYDPDPIRLNTSGRNTTLYFLGTDDGIYVTFQIVNTADQVIDDVEVNAQRTISGSAVVVGTGTTGDDGTVTLWLNPDFIHTFTFEKAGFETYTSSFAPTQTDYTITLSGGATDTARDYTRGISTVILPSEKELFNDTAYDFEFNVSSSYWSLDSFGFSLRLSNGLIAGSDSSTVSGTPATVNYDVNNQSIIYMDYYWIIEGNSTNSTTYWVITNTEYTGWSIKTFFTDLIDYMDTEMFGIDDFGKMVIVFLILFVSVGIMSYKFGASNPMVVTAMIFAIIFFFDVIVEVIPAIRGINYVLTYLAALILVLSVIREVSRG